MRKTIQITASATSPELTTIQPARDRFLFRTAPPDNLQAKALARLATSGFPSATATARRTCQRLAIAYIDNAYGTGLASAVGREFLNGGGVIVATTVLPTNVQKHYSHEANEVTAGRPDCAVIIASPEVGAQFLADVHDVNTVAQLPPGFFLLGADGLYNQAFLASSRPDLLEGMLGTQPDSDPPTLEYRQFRDLYASQFPVEAAAGDLPPYASNQYDACILAALAVEEAGTTSDPTRIRDALIQVSRDGTAFGPAQLADAFRAIQLRVDIDYKGASGSVDFDENGDVEAGYIVWKVVGGKFVTIARIGASELN
jgi:branched-chain amino acid transport system substrate-binding protein